MPKPTLILIFIILFIGCSSIPKVSIDSEYNGIYLTRDISIEPLNYTIINTTCVAISKNVYFYIENGLVVEPDILWDLITSFEEKFHIFKELFGEWNDIDKNGKLTFIIANIKPTVMGYFSPADRLPQSIVDKLYIGHKSNEADIFYITHYYLQRQRWKEKSSKVMATLFHELSHAVMMDNRANASSLPLWLEEGLARYAEYSLGFNNIFANDSSRLELISKEPGYPYAFLFINYLTTQYGQKIIKKIISSKNSGLNLLSSITGSSFGELYSSFLISSYTNFK